MVVAVAVVVATKLSQSWSKPPSCRNRRHCQRRGRKRFTRLHKIVRASGSPGQKSEIMLKKSTAETVRASGSPGQKSETMLKKSTAKIVRASESPGQTPETILNKIDCENCSRFWESRSKIRKSVTKSTATIVRASGSPGHRSEKSLENRLRELFALLG